MRPVSQARIRRQVTAIRTADAAREWPGSGPGVAQERPAARARATLPPMSAMDELADRLDAAGAAITAMGPAVAAGEPWPLTETYGPGPESEWGPREILAHVAEMIPYWLGEIERIVDAGATPGGQAGGQAGPEAPGFGRLEDDPVRVQIIGRDRTFPARELLARIEGEAGRTATRLRALQANEAGFVGRHVTRGDLTVAEIAERLIVGHVEGHVEQLRDIVAAAR